MPPWCKRLWVCSMNVLEKAALGLGLVVVGITAAYRHVLTDEQRDALNEAAVTVAKAVQDISDSISPLVSKGPAKAEERAAAVQNRASTAAQWESLGY